MTKFPKIKFGQPLGTIPVSPEIMSASTAIARQFLKEQVANGYMTDVDTHGTSARKTDWLPTLDLAKLGFAPDGEQHWVMTTGVESHADEIWGTTLVWVLVNDGMYFKQGREKIVHKPGEWYIFNDWAQHEVDATKGTPQEAVYLGWAVKLKPIKAAMQDNEDNAEESEKVDDVKRPGMA